MSVVAQNWPFQTENTHWKQPENAFDGLTLDGLILGPQLAFTGFTFKISIAIDNWAWDNCFWIELLSAFMTVHSVTKWFMQAQGLTSTIFHFPA